MGVRVVRRTNGETGKSIDMDCPSDRALGMFVLYAYQDNRGLARPAANTLANQLVPKIKREGRWEHDGYTFEILA